MFSGNEKNLHQGYSFPRAKTASANRRQTTIKCPTQEVYRKMPSHERARPAPRPRQLCPASQRPRPSRRTRPRDRLTARGRPDAPDHVTGSQPPAEPGHRPPGRPLDWLRHTKQVHEYIEQKSTREPDGNKREYLAEIQTKKLVAIATLTARHRQTVYVLTAHHKQMTHRRYMC